MSAPCAFYPLPWPHRKLHIYAKFIYFSLLPPLSILCFPLHRAKLRRSIVKKFAIFGFFSALFYSLFYSFLPFLFCINIAACAWDSRVWKGRVDSICRWEFGGSARPRTRYYACTVWQAIFSSCHRRIFLLRR